MSHAHKERRDGVAFSLGSWCSARRTERNAGKLSEEHIIALDALGFEWDPAQVDFQRGLDVLEQFAKREGHTRIPRDVTEVFNGEDFKLGWWCDYRRKQWRRGTLSAENIAALDALGFIWDSAESDFQYGLGALAQFVKREGHARVKHRHKETIDGVNFNLGTWCASRRKEWKAGKLAEERIAALDAHGFEWTLR